MNPALFWKQKAKRMFLLTTAALDIYAFCLLLLHIYSFCPLVLSFVSLHNFSSQALNKISKSPRFTDRLVHWQHVKDWTFASILWTSISSKRRRRRRISITAGWAAEGSEACGPMNDGKIVLEEGEHKQAVQMFPMFALFEDVLFYCCETAGYVRFALFTSGYGCSPPLATLVEVVIVWNVYIMHLRKFRKRHVRHELKFCQQSLIFRQQSLNLLAFRATMSSGFDNVDNQKVLPWAENRYGTGVALCWVKAEAKRAEGKSESLEAKSERKARKRRARV